MTADTATNETTQTQLLAKVDKDLKNNTRDAKVNFTAGVILGAAALLMSVVFPPAGFAGFATSVVAIMASLKGWDLVENLGKEKSLQKAKKEVTGDATAAKTKSRHGFLKKWATRGILATAGLLVAAVAAPLLPAAILSAATASVLTTVLSYAAFAVVVPTCLAYGARDGAGSIVTYADKLAAPAEAAPAPAAAPDQAPGARSLASVPSPAATFDKAANVNAPAAETAEQPKAPASKPLVP